MSAALPLSDDRLTARAVGGDERAFATIFERYQERLYRYCLSLVGNAHDAQDALQNTMVKVLAALPGEKREIELKPWLYRIAHNESIELLRRRRPAVELDPEVDGGGDGVEEEAAQRQRLARLLADLRELPERQRGALVMRELGGLGFEEIGAAFGTSAATARQTLYEARLGLRAMEEGREMRCAEVTRAISDGDRRALRRREIRAHLRGCEDCRAFREEIEGRGRAFAAISPLPAVAVAAMLKGLVGGGSGAGSGGLGAALGGGATKAVATSTLLKGVATVAVVAAVGVGAADRTGLVDIGGAGGGSQATESSTTESSGSGAGPTVTIPHSAARGDRARAAVRARAALHAGSRARGAGPGSAAPPSTTPTGETATSPSAEAGKPAASAHGQETAASHKAAGKGHATHPTHPAHPAHPAHPESHSGSHPEHPEHPEHPAHSESPGPEKGSSGSAPGAEKGHPETTESEESEGSS
jgi:RNA polymerase sigma factor (sigma-70 family)